MILTPEDYKKKFDDLINYILKNKQFPPFEESEELRDGFPFLKDFFYPPYKNIRINCKFNEYNNCHNIMKVAGKKLSITNRKSYEYYERLVEYSRTYLVFPMIARWFHENFREIFDYLE